MVSPALLPLLLSTAFFSDLDRPSIRLLDQDFHHGLRTLPRFRYLIPRDHLSIDNNPWADLLRPEVNEISNVKFDKNEFKVILDVQQFKPEEIDIKVVDDHIVVEAKHEEKKDDHGYISRQFVRRYTIPENIDLDTISSNISTDGILTIQASVKKVEEEKNIRRIKIEHTGKPALKHSEEKKKEETTTTSNDDFVTIEVEN